MLDLRSTSRKINMATIKAQRKWRDKNRFVKSQLNVMAKKYVHLDLKNFSIRFHLKGKGEAVTFAVFITRALLQRSDFDSETAILLENLVSAYHRDRDLYKS